MSEPDFIYQCGGLVTMEQRQNWIRERSEEAAKLGGTFSRCTAHNTIPNLFLFESWKERPYDQGEQRWQMGVAMAETYDALANVHGPVSTPLEGSK